MALGATAGPDTHWEGADALLRMLRARALDPETGAPRPRHFASLAELLVDQALPLALAAVRDAAGASPAEAAELLLEARGLAACDALCDCLTGRKACGSASLFAGLPQAVNPFDIWKRRASLTGGWDGHCCKPY